LDNVKHGSSLEGMTNLAEVVQFCAAAALKMVTVKKLKTTFSNGVQQQACVTVKRICCILKHIG
jgi:hypothetical protein